MAARNHNAYWQLADYVHANQKDIGVEPAAVFYEVAIEQTQTKNLPGPLLQECIEKQSADVFNALRNETMHQLGVREVRRF